MGHVVTRWIRTCQECGHKQTDRQPDNTRALPDSYLNRRCRKCKSEALDYGTFPSDETEVDE